jgi:hypothetical protein
MQLLEVVDIRGATGLLLGQVVQDALLAAAYLPPGHVLHSVLSDLYLPAGQSLQPEPVAAPHFPEGQFLHWLTTSDAEEEYFPRAHLTHVVVVLL